MLSPYKIYPNKTDKRSKKASSTIVENNSHCEHEHKRPQMTSNDLEVKPVKIKDKLNGGTNIESDDE